MQIALSKMTSGRGRKERVTGSFHIGWESGPTLFWNMNLSDPKYDELRGLLEWRPRTNTWYTRSGKHSHSWLDIQPTVENIERVSVAVFKKPVDELFSALNGKIERDRNGFYTIDDTFYRKRPKRHRFNKTLDPLLSRLIKEPFPEPVTLLQRTCNNCGVSGAGRDLWHWRSVPGMGNSDYISGCKSCGAQKSSDGPLNGLFPNTGPALVSSHWEGNPVLVIGGIDPKNAESLRV